MAQSTGANEKMYIRPATPSDAPAMARIAFLTADSGKSAEGKMKFEELPGLVYLLPYVTPLPEGGGRVKGTMGFVLVERRPVSSVPNAAGIEETKEDGQGKAECEEVIAGFSLLAADSLAYRDATEKYWWPSLRARYPLELTPAAASTSDDPEAVAKPSWTPLDEHFLSRIHHPRPFPLECLAFSPAHMHINILPGYHRRGWGRKLVGAVVERARAAENLDGVYLGYLPDNVDAARFYHRIGFRHEYVEGAPWTYCGLKFEEFV